MAVFPLVPAHSNVTSRLITRGLDVFQLRLSHLLHRGIAVLWMDLGTDLGSGYSTLGLPLCLRAEHATDQARLRLRLEGPSFHKATRSTLVSRLPGCLLKEPERRPSAGHTWR